jgi:xylono-1,5-lactonase
MEALAKGYGLIEGPVWDRERGLIYSDVLFGGVYALGRDGRVSTVFEHRRGIGGMSLHVDGGLVVSGRNISYKPFGGGATVTLLDSDPDNGNVGYNDITTDAKGRIYAGSLGASPVFADGRAPQAGNLYLIDLDGSSRMVGRDVQLTNGLGFSPDGRTLYHSDSRRSSVFCYSVANDGSLGEKKLFAKAERGVPDGLVVSVDGAVWVALAGNGHGVAVYAPDGKQREFVEIPQAMCTSVCFGGDDLKDLYIVSGSEGTGSDRGGAVYKYRSNVAGLPVPPARVAIPKT